MREQRGQIEGHGHRQTDARHIELPHVGHVDPVDALARRERRESRGARRDRERARERDVGDGFEHLDVAQLRELRDLSKVEGGAQRFERAREDLRDDDDAHASCNVRHSDAMRIVHVVQGLGIGGQERLVIYLSHELARRGHEPAIVTLSLGGELRAEANGDARLRRASRRAAPTSR